MSFIVDVKTFLEALTSYDVYPFTIPQGSSLPAIQSDMIDFSRDLDSNLDSSNMINYRFQFTLVSNNTNTLLDDVQVIVQALEGYSGAMGTSKILTTRVQNTIPLYDDKQQTFEYAIDVLFRVLQ